MNGHIYISAGEWERLEGLPHFVIALYLALKRHADYRTGMVGVTRKISWMLLRSEMYVEKHQGFEESGTPSLGKVRRAMEWLKRQGLVEDQGGKQRYECIVFKLVLAPTDFQAQNKPGKNPAKTRQSKPGNDLFEENTENSYSYDESQGKPGKNPAISESKNPADINSQTSNMYTGTTVVPDIPPVVNIHTSSSTKSSALSAQVSEVFTWWQKAMGKTRAALDNKRKARIEWAIKTYGLESCLLAINGCAASEWHQGKNDNGRKYDDITLIFRDASHTERFIAIAEKPAPRKSGFDEWIDDCGSDVIEAEIVQPQRLSGGFS